MSQINDIFKVALLSPDVDSYKMINVEDSIFGYEFFRSYVDTQGAAFAFAHFNVDYQRLTAQFWALDPNPQWASVRNLYLKKTSGLILLINQNTKGWQDTINRLLIEFMAVNHYSVPILIISKDDKEKKSLYKFKNNLVRWTGYEIPIIYLKSNDNTNQIMNQFMTNVKNWRANTVVFQTLKLYFSFDCILRSSRPIRDIIKHLRKIFISRYIRLVDDNYLQEIIIKAAIKSGFSKNETDIVHKRELRDQPFEFLLLNEENSTLKLKKPNIRKL